MEPAAAPHPALVDAALTELSRALGELPAPETAAPRWAVLRAGSLLRIRGDQALDDDALWASLVPPLRCRAFAHAAQGRHLAVSRWRGAPPSARVAAAVTATLGELPQPLASLPELALAIWSGVEVRLGGPERMSVSQDALDYAIQWGVPASAADAERLAAGALGEHDVGTEALRCTIVKAHVDAPAAALEVAGRIGMPSLRMHSLFELAVATRGAAGDAPLAAALRDAGAATRAACVGQEMWLGAADLQAAAVLAATDPAAVEQADLAFGRGLELLAGQLTADARVRLYRLGLIAGAFLGVSRWGSLVERLLADRQLLRDAYERANLVFEIAASTAHFADPARRSEALGRVSDTISRTPDLALRALVCAELAARTKGLPDRSPATWLAEARKALLARPSDAPFFAQTLRSLAETDLDATLGLVRSLPRPADRALGALMVAETAAGIRED